MTEAERRVLRAVPQLQKLIRGWQFVYRDGVMLKNMHHRGLRKLMQAISKAYMRATIDDPALREKLTPDFEIGCKRILITSVWYPALNQPNVDLETSRITEIREHAVVTADGDRARGRRDRLRHRLPRHRPADRRPHPRARRAVARRTWGDAPKAYRGVTTTNFPNLFRIGSIGTGTGHMSQIMQIESAITYVMDALRTMEVARPGERRGDAGRAGPVRAPGARDGQPTRSGRPGGCNSWYLDPGGEPSAVWPSSAWHYRKWTRHFDVEAYRVTERAPVGAPVG